MSDLVVACRVPLCEWCDRWHGWCLCQPALDDPVAARRAVRRVNERHAAAVALARVMDARRANRRTAA